MALRREEPLKPTLKPVRVRPIVKPRRHRDLLAVEALQALAKHRPVVFFKQPGDDVDHATRVNPEYVSIVGEVMDRAQRQSIAHGSRALLVCDFDDVRGVQWRALAEHADGAALPIGG